MKKNRVRLLTLATVLFAGFCCSAAFAQGADKCPGNRVWNVAVVQAGPYIDFRKVFRQTVLALKDKGLVQQDIKVDATTRFDDVNTWQSIAASSQQGCLRFLDDSLYDARLSDRKNKENIAALKARIHNKKDIDMIWAMGTAAGYAAAKAEFTVPTLVMTASDPESAGIVGPGEYSHHSMLHVQKEVDRDKSGLTMFYKIFNFKKLGTLVDIRKDIQKAQALPVVEQLSKELGFELVVCKKDINGPDRETNFANYSQCIIDLAKECDAVYLTVGNGIDPENHYMQLKPLIDNKIPTFSQVGSIEVESGALLAMSETDLVESGQFEASAVEQIMHGREPGAISQYYYSPLSLSLNMHVARLMHWKPPFDLLIAVDRVYDSINKD